MIVEFLTVLTLSDALQTARKNQPQIMQARANTQAADARVIQRRAPLLPQLTGTASYLRTTQNCVANPGQPPCPPPSHPTTDTFNNWNLGLQLDQLVWDWGTSWHTFRSSKALARSQLSTEKSTILNIESQVRTTYFNARAQKALVQVAKELLENQERHLKQIDGFVRVGSRPEIDLAQARTDRANAQVQVINAENGYDTARAQLNLAIGIDGPANYDVSDETLLVVPGEDEPTDVLLVEAIKARPELDALEQQVVAQQLALGSAKGAYGPSLFIGSGLTARGTDITDLGVNWNASVSLRWSIFSGLSTYGVVKEAAAGVTALEAQLMSLKQQVRLEVEQARLAVRAAKASLSAAEEALANAQQRLRLAEGRYQAGVGSVIELGDAQVALTNAQAQRVQAEYALSSARAQLVHALGRRSA